MDLIGSKAMMFLPSSRVVPMRQPTVPAGVASLEPWDRRTALDGNRTGVTSDHRSMRKMKLNRRSFVKTLSAMGSGAAVPAAAEAQQTQTAMTDMHMHHHGMKTETVAAKGLAPAAEKWEAYTFLNADEAAFVEAAVNTLIPADDLSPSGGDVGVAYFIYELVGVTSCR